MRIFILSLSAILLVLPLAASMAAGGSSARIQVVDERGVPVRNAVVEITPARGVSGPIRFPWRAAMAQRDLEFTPGTLIVAKGSTVAFPNLDRVRHGVYSFSRPARFSFNLYGRDQSRSQRMPIAGTVAVGCNIHDNMRGYIRVVETPYAGKTDANGYMSAASIPGGPAEITVWHPGLRAPGNEVKEAVTISGRTAKRITVRLR